MARSVSTTPYDPLKQRVMLLHQIALFKGILTSEDERYDTLSLLATPVTCVVMLNPNVNDSRSFPNSNFFKLTASSLFSVNSSSSQVEL